MGPLAWLAFAANSTQNVSSLGLPANTYISKLEFSYGTVPGASRLRRASMAPRFATGWDGNPVNDGDNMVNNGQMDWTFLGSPNTRTDSTTNPIHEPTVTPFGSQINHHQRAVYPDFSSGLPPDLRRSRQFAQQRHG